jgi:hypothetical protein
MIEKQTIIDQIEITRNKTIQIRLGLLLIEDGKEISCAWHRTSIEPGTSIDDQMAAVNAHLQQMGKSPVALEKLAEIKQVASIMHTPAVVAEHKQKQEEARLNMLREKIPPLNLN